MAISKVADRATVNSNTAATTHDYVLSGMTVGNVLIIRVAADNAGASGAASTLTVTNQSGTPIDVSTDTTYSQNVDPSGARAGATCFVVVAVITAASGTVRLTYGNSVVQAGVAEEWTGIDIGQGTNGVIGTPVGANSTASTNLANVTDTSVANNNMAYGAIAIEGPSTDLFTQDGDTTNGSWSSLTKAGTTNGTADTNQTTVGGFKIVTATGSQSYNPTNSLARDSAGLILEFATAPWYHFQTAVVRGANMRAAVI